MPIEVRMWTEEVCHGNQRVLERLQLRRWRGLRYRLPVWLHGVPRKVCCHAPKRERLRGALVHAEGLRQHRREHDGSCPCLHAGFSENDHARLQHDSMPIEVRMWTEEVCHGNQRVLERLQLRRWRGLRYRLPVWLHGVPREVCCHAPKRERLRGALVRAEGLPKHRREHDGSCPRLHAGFSENGHARLQHDSMPIEARMWTEELRHGNQRVLER